jgi:hypothetical protein
MADCPDEDDHEAQLPGNDWPLIKTWVPSCKTAEDNWTGRSAQEGDSGIKTIPMPKIRLALRRHPAKFEIEIIENV